MPNASPARPRSPRPGRLALAAQATLALAAALLILAQPAVSRAQAAEAAPKPAKKDSSLRIKPPQVTLTPSVTPSQARPGETVTYKVTAKLQPHWHIYDYTKTQPDEGPVTTKFDFFDTGGLIVEGDWTPSRPPTVKKDPAFPNLDSVKYFEDEASWSIKLKVPPDAKPGTRVLRSQATYQVCDASRCSFPGQWTLPPVELTVLPADGEPPQAKDENKDAPADRLVAVAAAPAEAPKPKRKDSSERLKPRAVKLSAEVEPKDAGPGDTVLYKVTARIDPGWHIYDFAKEQPPQGPKNTQFDFFDTAGLTPAGDWKSDVPAVVKEEPAFNNLVVSYFEDHVTWTLPLKVPADAAPGPKTLRNQIAFQICNATSCMPPVQWTLPDVTLNVIKGHAPVAANVAKAEAPAATPSEPAPVAAKTTTPAAEAGTAPATDASSDLATALGTKDSAGPGRVVSDVEKKAQQGIIPLMIASALGGLLALVMPCVWPMVPITVNFFVKQGEKNKGKTTGLAITYCLAIIGVFTTVGVLCSFFLSATALPRLANNPWLNLFVAGLFLVFGLSLLGLFEIRLPNSLLNASSKGESRGGLVGVMFMALTLTITSFTCTFPVVGGLLVMASTGQFFYPIIGLATFSTVLALPFFLLALSPGLLSKVPKSGDWMNAVKVVGGLVEIGAAFKFLNTAELSYTTPENAWINAPLILTVWIVLAAVCGFYMLGFFRTDHDHDEIKIGPGRMILGIGFLCLALFLAPALFGRPPQSPIWDTLVGFLPPDVSNLAAGKGSAGADGRQIVEEAKHATSGDPKVAERQEKRFHGVWWGFSYEEALEKAKAENKPILIDFTGINCANCRTMEASVLPKPEVVQTMREFVPVQLYTLPNVPISSIDVAMREALAEQNTTRQLDLTNEPTNPLYVVLSPDEQVLGASGGLMKPDVFISFLKKSLGKMKGEGKVAQAETPR